MSNTESRDTAKDIRIAFFLNLAFTIFEIFGAYWTNSMAILSDSVHDLGDSLSLGFSWYLEKYSQKGGDRWFSYGYKRFSLLGALINTLVLVVGSMLVLSSAIPRLLDPEQTRPEGMVIFAVIGIVVNGLAVLRLSKAKTMNARVVAWHLAEDVLGWIAVLAVSIVLLFTDLYILDPMLAIVITAYILFNVVRNMRKTLALFLQGVPEHVDLDLLDDEFAGIDFVESIHHTHVWSLDGIHHVLTTHVVVDECATREDVMEVRGRIKQITDDYQFEHTTIEIEYGDEDCRMAKV